MEFMGTLENFTISNMNLQFMMRNKENLSNCYGYTLNGHLNNSESSYMSGANIIFQKLTKSSNSKSEVSFMFDNNIRKKFENFTKYISNKEQSLMRDSMDHWNQMSTGYSEFFTSPKGYSCDNNSVASYLIGGFVGSKSQMNNEKHKLSYDLGEVIFKILNDYKCDKSLDKLKEEKKFDVNKIGRKSKFFPKDQNELFECEYNMAIWNSLVDKSKDTVKILNDNSHNKSMEVNKENIKNLSKVTAETALFVNPILNMKSISNGKNCPPNGYRNGNNVIMCLDTSNNSCEEKNVDINSIKDNSNTNIPLKSEVENISSDMEKRKSDMNLANISSSTSGHSHVTEFRRRQYSECSAESTDSESFIVFEGKCCDSSYELANLNYQESEYEDSDCYCEDDDCLYEEDFESSCSTENKDEFDNAYEDREVREANKRWSSFYRDVAVKKPDDSVRKVRFNDKPQVHKIIAWDYAYRTARHGPWEQMARDRDRFGEKIQRLGSVISPVLEESHRKSIYEKLHK